MRRRDFIKIVGGIGVAWPLAVHAQQPEEIRRIGVLMNTAADDREGQDGMAAFQVLQQLGWTVGRNAQIDIRWGENNGELDRKYATELVALAPDVILASGSPSVTALQHITRTVPIVFVRVSDPVGGGFVDSLDRPGGNATGFMLFEYSFAGKWLELLKQIVPRLTRASVLRDSNNRAGIGEFAAIQSVAPSLGVELRPVDTRDAAEIERILAAYARSPNGGLIVTPSASVSVYRDAIITLAARYRLPAVYGFRYNVIDGGLISYGPNRVDQFRRAAEYVDRILKRAKPGELPVQAPARYETVINLKTAKALDLTVPPSLLATADEVIE
jgi:putative tryptophan/tyrosine transport system substrate-binding protein